MNQLKIYWDKSFTDWRYRLVLHVGFWLFFLSSWLDETMVVHIEATQHYLVTLTGGVFALYLYYTLTYLIWPLVKKRKWFWFFLALIPYYIIAVVLRTYHISLIVQWHNLHNVNIQGGEFWQHIFERQLNLSKLTSIIFSGFTSLIDIIFIPLAIKFLRYAYQFSQQQAWMLKENAQLQLNTLKAQLNPHFFFNTLNNLQSFIVQRENEKSVELLNKLADFMRTSLYDGSQEFITMKKEVELLRNYIDLEKVRFEEEVDIIFELADDYLAYQIPPFIFLPFIENVFKHGGGLPTAQIKIEIMLVHHKDKIILKTANAFNCDPQSTVSQGGIGLENVRKRLDFYFPNGYLLDLKIIGNTFNVNLELNK